MLVKTRDSYRSFIDALTIVTLLIGCNGQRNIHSIGIGDAPKGSTKTYLVKCRGICKDISAIITTDSGDPDIYASERQPPEIGTT